MKQPISVCMHTIVPYFCFVFGSMLHKQLTVLHPSPVHVRKKVREELYFCNIAHALAIPDQESFFVALVKPHKSVSSQTLARWMKSILTSAGVDSSIWKPHAVKSAAAAHLKLDKNLDLPAICKPADWSQACGTFLKFYQRYV